MTNPRLNRVARDHIDGIMFRARKLAKSGEELSPKQLATELLSIGIAMSNLWGSLQPDIYGVDDPRDKAVEAEIKRMGHT